MVVDAQKWYKIGRWKMKKHVRAMTYQPKIDAVFSGVCTQTIRPGHDVAVGDEILFHTWTGKPYRSKWGKRLRVRVKEVIDIVMKPDGIVVDGAIHSWNSEYVNHLAELDHIDPPTGQELRNVLCEYNSEQFEAQIIRW